MTKRVLTNCKKVIFDDKKNLIIIILTGGLIVTSVWIFFNQKSNRENLQELRYEAEYLDESIMEANNKLDSVADEVMKKTDELNFKINGINKTLDVIQSRLKEASDQQSKDRHVLEQISRGALTMRATAYDLTVESCGKRKGHPAYGITKSGTKAVVGRTVAVDPNIIPLGSKLSIKFPKEYKRLDGIYIAEDTGSAVKGDIIDIFLGENEPEVDIFGCRKVTVYVLRKGWSKQN
jgi:3D (Asp-Asp-Asp) domain-containing protein